MSEWSKRYEYTRSGVQDNAPSTSGVYRLIYHLGESYYVFYVGQSEDLQKRLNDHLASSEENSCIKQHLREHACYFRYLEIDSASERDSIEQEQIDKFEPKCNS